MDPAEPNLLAVVDGESEDESEPGELYPWSPDDQPLQVDDSSIETPELTPVEREQLLSLVHECGAVFDRRPGRASVVEHHAHSSGG